MKKIPSTFNLDTATVFTYSSSKGHCWMIIITIFLLANIFNCIIYMLFFAAVTYLIHRWKKYKSHAFLTAESSLHPQNFSQDIHIYIMGTPENNELHILKDLLQIAVITTPFKIKCGTVTCITEALVGEHRAHFPSSLERQNLKHVICDIFEISLTELHLQTKDKHSNKQYVWKDNKRENYTKLKKRNPLED